MSLTPKQERFVQEYLLDLNATAAAGRAGYKHKGQAGQLMLDARVQDAIAARARELAEKTGLKAEAVLGEIQKLAFLDPAAFFSKEGQLLPVVKMPEHARRALSGIEWGRDGPKLRFTDKLRALEMLGKHLKLFASELPLGAKRVSVIIDMGEE